MQGQISHYKIESKIQAGGMGVVYKARDLKLPRDVALKFLPRELLSDDTAKKRFKREAEAASALDHPNICTIYEIDETPEGHLFIAMAYYDGESLKQRIEHGALDVRAAFEIAALVASGLGRAHRAGIVHRDIKPGNIMITSDGFLKVVDFGVAKLADATRVTEDNYTVGTVAYMSPQQATGSNVDGRADIWSLGVVFYEMLAGSLPFKADVYEALIYAITHNDPLPPHELRPEVPESVSAVVMKCLRKDAGERYQTIEELMEDMDRVARGLGWGSSTIVPIAPAAPPPPSVVPKIVAALAIFSVLIVAGYLGRGEIRNVYERFFPPAEKQIFTTENRIAVLPIENMIGSSEDVLVDGLSEFISDLVEETMQGARSTWVVPYARVARAPLTSPTDAVKAFGVNRVVIGNLQRFGPDNRISLRLCNASDLAEIRSVDIRCNPLTGAGFSSDLLAKISELMETSATGVHSDVPKAVVNYVRTLGWLQRYQTETGAVDSAATYASRIEENNLGPLAVGRVLQTRYELDRNKMWLRNALSEYEQLDDSSVYQSIYEADAYYDLEDYNQAIANCQKALARAPGQARASLRLAWSYHNQKRYDEAEAAFKGTIERYPDYWANTLELGVLYYSNDRLDQAIDSWVRTLDYAPNDVTTLNNIGAVHWVRDEWASAREYFRRAFQISPTCDTCSNIGLLSYYEQDYEQSAQYYEFALEYCDTTSSIHWGNLASAQYWVEGKRGDAVMAYGTAIRHAERELRTEPENPDITSQLIRFYSMSGDEDNASRMIAYGLRVAGENNEVLFDIGHAYEKRGERQRALRYLGEALRHGYALSEIERTPMLAELVQDDLFKEMVAREIPENSPHESSREAGE